jgi:hypothetical protein
MEDSFAGRITEALQRLGVVAPVQWSGMFGVEVMELFDFRRSGKPFRTWQ